MPPRLLLVLLLLSSSGIALAEPEPKRFAIVIGNNAAPMDDPSLKALRFADDDAVRFLSLFSRVSDETWLLTVLDDTTQLRHSSDAVRTMAPTRDNLARAIAELSQKLEASNAANQPSVVYLTFSGHGRSNREGEPELVLLDGGLTRRALFETILARLPATRVHLLIDACNAGAMVGARGPFDREVSARTSTATPEELDALFAKDSLERFPHVGAIVAASAGQEAHEWSRVESGVFTHELISGLLGAADVNGDRVIEYSEIQAFAAAAHSQIDDPRARPLIRSIPPALDRRTPLVSLFWAARGPWLEGSATALGRFHLERKNGVRYLDAHLSGETSLFLLLPKDEPVYLRGEDFEIVIPPRNSGTIDLDPLERRPLTLAARGSLDVEYRRALFAVPFGPTYYLGYADSQRLVPVPLDIATGRLVLEDTEGWDRSSTRLVLFLGAGVALIGGIVTGAVALDTKRAFNETMIERDAEALASRYDVMTAISLSAFAAGLAAGGAGLWVHFSLEPDPLDAHTSPVSSGRRMMLRYQTTF